MGPILGGESNNDALFFGNFEGFPRKNSALFGLVSYTDPWYSKLIHGSCAAQIDFLRLQWLLGEGPQKVQIRGASNTGQGRQGCFFRQMIESTSSCSTLSHTRTTYFGFYSCKNVVTITIIATVSPLEDRLQAWAKCEIFLVLGGVNSLAEIQDQVVEAQARLCSDGRFYPWGDGVIDIMWSAQMQVAEVNSQTVSPSSHLAQRIWCCLCWWRDGVAGDVLFFFRWFNPRLAGSTLGGNLAPAFWWTSGEVFFGGTCWETNPLLK